MDALQTLSISGLIRVDEATLWLAGILSLFTFVSTLFLVPWLILRIPADYFVTAKRNPVPWADRHPAVRWTLLILKNLLGGVLIVMGLIMLVMPGQGLLTVFMGLVLLNFPGKYRLERWLVLRRPVWRAVNWLRQRYGREPLALD